MLALYGSRLKNILLVKFGEAFVGARPRQPLALLQAVFLFENIQLVRADNRSGIIPQRHLRLDLVVRGTRVQHLVLCHREAVPRLANLLAVWVLILRARHLRIDHVAVVVHSWARQIRFLVVYMIFILVLHAKGTLLPVLSERVACVILVCARWVELGGANSSRHRNVVPT